MEVALPGGALVCGGVSPSLSYPAGSGKVAVQAELRKQVDVFIQRKVDFLLGEVSGHEWIQIQGGGG